MLDYQDFWWESIIGGFSFGDNLLGGIEILIILTCGALLFQDATQESRFRLSFRSNKWKILISIIVLLTMLLGTSREAYRKYSTVAQAVLDKSPKLTGFVHRSMVADEPGTRNALIFLDVSVGNSGETPSIAEEYGMMAVLSDGLSTNAEAINFAQEYTNVFRFKENPWLIVLKREQLISEKTTKAIPSGESPRGWMAFRLRGIPINQLQLTNLVYSFLGINGTRVFITNGFSKGKLATTQPFDDLSTVISGADNIFYPVLQPARTNWLPPELPPGCSNVVIFFGAQGLTLPRQLAEIPSEGKKFLISELPDVLLNNLDKVPDYSPRRREMWFKASPPSFTIGGKTVDYPIQPIVISNRLYVEVEIPFSNERRKIVMSDGFSSELPIPQNWDINFSTNYDAYGNGIYAYEVVNELANPVLQVVYASPSEVYVNGIFQVESNSIVAAFGDQPIFGTFIITHSETNQALMTASLQIENFHETLIIHSNETIASFANRFTNELFKPIFKYQRALFKYPSNRNLGVFADNPNSQIIPEEANKTKKP